MTEHSTPQEPGEGSAGRIVGAAEHAPGDAHHPPRHAPAPERDRLSSTVAAAQFLFTGILLAVVAALMYTAGLKSGKGGEGGAPAGGGTQQAAAVDVQALLKASPELVAGGKNLFSVNCASCHGTGGKGDGPAASALNPKPRDFTSGYWRYGGGVARIVQTITAGSPGTAMAPFPGIPIQDRFALAHYVRTFDPSKQEADKPEDLAWLDQFGGAKKDTTGGAGGAVAAGPAPGDTIPIARAMALIVERPSAPAIAAMAGAPPDSGEGARLFASRCASCHGAWGQGGVRTRMLGSAPYVYVTTRSLAATGPLAGDAAGFEKLILYGLPGSMHPGNGDLSSEQIRALYDLTQSLRARLAGAARARS